SASPSRGRSYSTSAFRYAPPARPAGFHQLADASSATAVKAPPIPCARMPKESAAWAPAGADDTTSSEAVRNERNRTEARNGRGVRIRTYLSVLCAFLSAGGRDRDRGGLAIRRGRRQRRPWSRALSCRPRRSA